MHITLNGTPIPAQVTVRLKAEAAGKLYDVGTLTFETDDSRTAHLDTPAIAEVVRQAEEALSTPHPSKDVSGQHVIHLDGTAQLTHPAGCPDPVGCLFTAAVAALTITMLATGGTWTCDLTDNGTLILLERLTAPT